MGKIVSQDELILLTVREKRNGRRVVFTNGCFDLLHPGHVRCLAEARSLGDLLVVAVNSDGSVRGNKGPERPLVPQNDRAEVLAALASVDYVTIFDEPTPRDLIARLLPSVLVKGADAKKPKPREAGSFPFPSLPAIPRPIFYRRFARPPDLPMAERMTATPDHASTLRLGNSGVGKPASRSRSRDFGFAPWGCA